MRLAALLMLLAVACSDGGDNPSSGGGVIPTVAVTNGGAGSVTGDSTTTIPTTTVAASTTTAPATPEVLCPGAVAAYAGLSQVASPNPVLNAAGIATFTFTAPTARRVVLTGSWKGTLGYWVSTNMRSDGAGNWSATVGPLAPGTYRYLFEVDGVDTLDPANPNGSQGVDSQSVFFVPGPGGEFVDPTAPAVHGTVRSITYRSNVTGTDRTATVWTPPGYETTNTTYPTLYLVHGGGAAGGARYWVSQVWGNVVLDNLSASGAMVPFVVVMPDGNVPGTLGAPGDDTFGAELLDNLVPAVEGCFRVSISPADRALAGLSNGGVQTWSVLITRPGAFAYVATMSSGYSSRVISAIRRSGVLESNRDAINSLTVQHRIYIGNSADTDYAINQATRALFDEYGIAYQFAGEYPSGHSYITWQHNLLDLAPLLFR